MPAGQRVTRRPAAKMRTSLAQRRANAVKQRASKPPVKPNSTVSKTPTYGSQSIPAAPKKIKTTNKETTKVTRAMRLGLLGAAGTGLAAGTYYSLKGPAEAESGKKPKKLKKPKKPELGEDMNTAGAQRKNLMKDLLNQK